MSNCYQSIGCFIRQMIERIVLPPRVTSYKLPQFDSESSPSKNHPTLPYSPSRNRLDSTRLERKLEKWPRDSSSQLQTTRRKKGWQARAIQTSVERSSIRQGQTSLDFSPPFQFFVSPEENGGRLSRTRRGDENSISRSKHVAARRVSCFVFRVSPPFLPSPPSRNNEGKGSNGNKTNRRVSASRNLYEPVKFPGYFVNPALSSAFGAFFLCRSLSPAK